MNSDYITQNDSERNLNMSRSRRCRTDTCPNIKTYAKNQNTVYDPINNLMLYGINSNMAVSGVSDGTCNQINPLIFTQMYKCGSGAAGGNPCVPDAYGIENFESGDSCGVKHLFFVLIFVLIILYLIHNKNNKN
jgi:hypothetical protein